MQWLQAFGPELATTLANDQVWLALVVALVAAATCFLLGGWAARSFGLLPVDALTGEVIGVGLGTGVVFVACAWAAIASVGRSAFTPVAASFLIALGASVVRRRRSRNQIAGTPVGTGVRPLARRQLLRSAAVAIGCGAAIFAAAAMYGSTQAPSPREGRQPIEFNDVAFYSVLAADLSATGTESTYSPSGFAQIVGVPRQMWYHWGEIWLASAVISLADTPPLIARHIVVLPILLLAAATLTGTIVRRATRTTTKRAFAWGAAACLLLAPIPLLDGPFFSSWAVGLLSGITIYGLAAVAVLLAMYCLFVVSPATPSNWGLAISVGAITAVILPAHLVIALLTYFGIAVVIAVRVGRTLKSERRLPHVGVIWRQIGISTAVILGATIGWGALTGHGVAPSAAPQVPSFNATWQQSLGITVIGAGAFIAVAVGIVALRRDTPLVADLCAATLAVLLAGAVIWGARLSEFTMFYFFYAGIAVIATPIAAIASWLLVSKVKGAGYSRVAVALAILLVFQLELGAATAMRALQQFGPNYYPPISETLLASIRQLPADAKLAYSCKPFDETGFVGATLLSINAHTGREVIPMCYEAEVLNTLVGLEPSTKVENAYFRWAPQRVLYPNDYAQPTSAEVAAFLKSHGIHYIYSDDRHPNTLVEGTIPVVSEGDEAVSRVP